jgi:thiaminase (transcriptional activator TenA)
MLAKRLFGLNAETVEACLSHPFVQGIGDGTLPLETFKAYVAQDAFFLRSFARAYCVAAARAPNVACFEGLLTMAGGVLTELKLHREFAGTLSIDLDIVVPLPETLAYTDFLLKTAWHHDLPQTIAAMAPCMRLYAYLGQQLATGGVPNHRFTGWIRTYSSPEFEELAAVLDNLLDAYAEDTVEVRAAYAKAMRLELGFFEACA